MRLRNRQMTRKYVEVVVLVNARRIFKKRTFKTTLIVTAITVISMWYNQEDIGKVKSFLV